MENTDDSIKVDPTSMEEALAAELELFNRIFQETSRILKDPDSISVDAVDSLLKARSEWIGMLKRLQMIHSNLEKHNPKYDTVPVQSKIQDTVRMICEMDERIFSFLQKKKLEIVKDISSLADNQKRRTFKEHQYLEKSRLLDIRQR